MTKLILLLVAVAAVLAFTNPSEADYREHVRKKQGVAGTAAMVVMDLISNEGKGGIKRDNYIVASRFYIGGDGLLPREELAWGLGGFFIEKK